MDYLILFKRNKNDIIYNKNIIFKLFLFLNIFFKFFYFYIQNLIFYLNKNIKYYIYN